MNYRILALSAAVSLAACSGGASSVPTTPNSSHQPGQGQAQSARVQLTFPVVSSGTHSAIRKPLYVPSTAATVVVTINSVNGSSTLPSWVTATTTVSLLSSGTCSNPSAGVETCVFQVPAPPGSVSYTFDIKDASNNLLATMTQTFTISQGTSNALSITLQGIVHTVTISGASLVANTPISQSAPQALTIQAQDASGAVISGTANYDAAITLTDNDPSGATQLTVGGTPASTVQVTKPGDTVAITYSGLAIVPFTIVATVGGNAAGSVTVTPSLNSITLTGTTTDTYNPADPNYNQPTVFFSDTTSTQQFTAAELGWSNAPFGKTFSIDSTACGSGASATATIAPASGTTFTVTPQNAAICKVVVSDGTGQTQALWISVTTSGFNIN
ncbi:MAG: hypothetical protein ACXVAK_04335 [Vulcanimicrobiaceae bacterium]